MCRARLKLRRGSPREVRPQRFRKLRERVPPVYWNKLRRKAEGWVATVIGAGKIVGARSSRKTMTL